MSTTATHLLADEPQIATTLEKSHFLSPLHYQNPVHTTIFSAARINSQLKCSFLMAFHETGSHLHISRASRQKLPRTKLTVLSQQLGSHGRNDLSRNPEPHRTILALFSTQFFRPT